MKAFKKALAYALAATLALGSCTSVFAASSPTEAPKPPKKEVDVKVEDPKDPGTELEVTTSKKGTATISKVETKSKEVTIPKTVTVNGVKYKVTVIAAGTFAEAKKATKVKIPANITKISKGAFKGATKLETVRIRITKASQITVKKGAFNGLNTKKMTIRVDKNTSAKALKKIQKAMKKAGFKGKVVKVKK